MERLKLPPTHWLNQSTRSLRLMHYPSHARIQQKEFTPLAYLYDSRRRITGISPIFTTSQICRTWDVSEHMDDEVLSEPDSQVPPCLEMTGQRPVDLKDRTVSSSSFRTSSRTQQPALLSNAFSMRKANFLLTAPPPSHSLQRTGKADPSRRKRPQTDRFQNIRTSSNTTINENSHHGKYLRTFHVQFQQDENRGWAVVQCSACMIAEDDSLTAHLGSLS